MQVLVGCWGGEINNMPRVCHAAERRVASKNVCSSPGGPVGEGSVCVVTWRPSRGRQCGLLEAQ